MEPNERNVIRMKRAQVASNVKEYLDEWQRSQLARIDRAAEEAMKGGTLDKKAVVLWVQRLEVITMMRSIEVDERRGHAAAGRLEGAFG